MAGETKVSNSNSRFIDHTVDKLFLWNNRYDKGLFDEPNSSGEFTLEQGQVIGRIASSGKLKICDATATDGSQFPIGVVAKDVTMAADATDVDVTYGISGDVDQGKLKFSGSQDLDTAVTVQDGLDPAQDTTYSRTLRDLIQSAGLRLVGGVELTDFDNS